MKINGILSYGYKPAFGEINKGNESNRRRPTPPANLYQVATYDNTKEIIEQNKKLSQQNVNIITAISKLAQAIPRVDGITRSEIDKLHFDVRRIDYNI